MIDKVTPSQMKYIDPYNQRIFDFNSSDHRVYLTRNINNVLKVIGNDIVVGGLNGTNLSCTDNVVSVAILPGIMIQDDTLLEITQDTFLNINCNLFSDTGFAIVHMHWKWINTPEPNMAQLRMSWVSADGETVYNNGWDLERDRTILCAIRFWKDQNNQIYKYQFYTGQSILVKGKEYYIKNTANSPLQGVIAGLNYYLFDEGQAPAYLGNIYKIRAVNGNLVLKTVTQDEYINNS
jgi:hypothetical protein